MFESIKVLYTKHFPLTVIYLFPQIMCCLMAYNVKVLFYRCYFSFRSMHQLTLYKTNLAKKLLNFDMHVDSFKSVPKNKLLHIS